MGAADSPARAGTGTGGAWLACGGARGWLLMGPGDSPTGAGTGTGGAWLACGGAWLLMHPGDSPARAGTGTGGAWLACGGARGWLLMGPAADSHAGSGKGPGATWLAGAFRRASPSLMPPQKPSTHAPRWSLVMARSSSWVCGLASSHFCIAATQRSRAASCSGSSSLSSGMARVADVMGRSVVAYVAAGIAAAFAVASARGGS